MDALQPSIYRHVAPAGCMNVHLLFHSKFIFHLLHESQHWWSVVEIYHCQHPFTLNIIVCNTIFIRYYKRLVKMLHSSLQVVPETGN